MNKDGAWRASKLAGVNVYNEANEKIGDINDVILDKSGKVVNVILGVGGFLGVGEHYVAVAYDRLRWVNEPVRSATVSANDKTARPATNVDGTARTAADGAPRATTGTATTARPRRVGRRMARDIMASVNHRQRRRQIRCYREYRNSRSRRSDATGNQSVAR